MIYSFRVGWGLSILRVCRLGVGRVGDMGNNELRT